MPGRGGLYVVTGEDFSKGRLYADVVRECIAGGAGIIQLREKNWSASRIIEIGRELREITRQARVLLIINDRVDLAIALDADGVHVGQQDIPLPIVRKLIGPNMLVGVSAGSRQEAIDAERDGANYIGVGPIFPTDTKKDASPPGGLALLTEIKHSTNLPLYAIGGIKVDNVASVIGAGADGVAVVSAIVGAEDIAKSAAAFIQEINKAAHNGRTGGIII